MSASAIIEGRQFECREGVLTWPVWHVKLDSNGDALECSERDAGDLWFGGREMGRRSGDWFVVECFATTAHIAIEMAARLHDEYRRIHT